MVASGVTARLTAADVDRIAALAHLELTDEERSQFTEQLAAVLEYAERVREIDTTGVVPTAHVLERAPALRDDEVAPSLPRDDVLASAPDADMDAGLFKVPRVLG